MRDHPRHRAVLLGHFGEIGSDAFFARAHMASGATFGLEVTQANQFFGSQFLPYGELRSSSDGRRLRGFGGRRLGVVRRLLILGRGDNGGGSQAGPRNGADNHQRDSKCSLAEAKHRAAVNEGNQKQRKHRDSWQDHAAEDFQRPLEELEHLEEKQEIPFRPGNVGGVGGVGQTFQRNLGYDGHGKQNDESERHADGVFEHLLGEELALGGCVVRGGSDAVFANQIDVNPDDDDRQRRQQDGMERIESRESDVADAVTLAAE